MPDTQWEKIESIFAEALDLNPSQRPGFVAAACHGDDTLRHEVESLLASDGDSDSRITGILTNTAASFSISDWIGKRLGAYRIVESVAHGGMGSVYLAVRDDDAYEKRVAIKVVRTGMGTESMLERFRHERRILANLEHLYIAHLIDGGATDTGVPYLVMEYVEGLPIDKYCETRNLTVEQRCELFRKVCEAVSYAHRQLVVHRDLKPSNILVTADGTPKLLDFGIAKLLSGDPAAGATAAFGQLLTPDYASPEQIRGTLITTASDVYSLGAVFYEILSGARATDVTSSSPVEVERAVCEAAVRRPSETAPRYRSRKLEGDLDNIALMALRKEPERRYQSVEQFSDDLGRYLTGRPVLAHEDTFRYRAGKFVQRYRFGVAAGIALFAMLSAGIATVSWQAHQVRIQKDVAERRLSQLVALGNTLLFDVNKTMERIPGAMEPRRQILKTTLAYLDGLARESGDDPKLRRAVAAAYIRIGEVQGGVDDPNLANLHGALASYRAALATLEPLAAGSPKDIGLQVELARARNREAATLFAQGKTTDAIAIYVKALAGIAPLESTGDREVLVGMADLYHGLSQIQVTINPANAAPNALRKLQIYEKLVTKYPNDVDLLDGLASSYVSMTGQGRQKGGVQGGLDYNLKALHIRERLVTIRPNDTHLQHNLLISYGRVGDGYGSPFGFNIGDRTEALVWYRKALGVAEKLSTADVHDGKSLSDLATASLRIGAVLQIQGSNKEAMQAIQRCLTVMEALRKQDPSSVGVRHQIAMAHEFEGRVWKQLGQLDKALACYRRSLEMSEALAAADPADSTARLQIVVDHGAIAESLSLKGSLDEALRTSRRMIALASEYRAGSLGVAGRKNEAAAYYSLGSVYAVAKRWLEARTAFEMSVDSWRRLPNAESYRFFVPGPGDADAGLREAARHTAGKL